MKTFSPDFLEVCNMERRLGERNLLLHSDFYSMEHGRISQDRVAISGGCGHLFIYDGSNRWEEHLLGEQDISGDFIGEWMGLLDRRRAIANTIGISLINLVVPEKQIVLPRFRWRYGLPQICANRLVKRLLQQLPRGSLLYPDAELRVGALYGELYWRGNCHWAPSGCLIAAQQVCRCFGLPDLPLEFLKLDRGFWVHDLASHFCDLGVDGPVEEVIFISSHSEKEVVDLRCEGKPQTGSRKILVNGSVASCGILVIFGDSFCFDWGMDYALSYGFREVHVFWSKNIDWDYVKAVGATHVLWESAERMLTRVPLS